MDILNIELISKLKNNITRKLNNQDEIEDITNFYGVFISDDNKFIICKEESGSLREFFTKEFVDFSEVRFNERVYPWRKAGMQYSFNLNGLYFCLPLVNLLGKHHKDGKVNKKDLTYLYCIVNEYFKKNPEFVNNLIENEKIR